MCRVGQNYIYTHIFKCGGTSVHNTLQQLDNTSNMLVGGHLDSEAIRNIFIQKNLLDEYESKFKFSVVRNPYDWLASVYYYIKRSTGHNYNKLMRSIDINQYIDWFIDEAMNFKTDEFQNKYLTQKQFLTKGREIDGEILVDYYSKVEDLDINWKIILDQIGLPYKPVSNVNKNPNKKLSYINDFNEPTKRRIRETFKYDFEFFGYDKH